jgi:threonine dehydrogenase-like Zn-dependent dehydrogenase
LTAPGARIVAVGLQADRLPTDFHALSMSEKEVVGTLAHVFGRDFAAAVDLLAADPPVWAALAPVVRPLTDLRTAGLDPPSTHDPGQTKLLFDPALSQPRPLRVA